METLDSMWFTHLDKTVGIIATKNDQGEVKFYLGVVDGVSEKVDIRRIKEWGAKVYPETMIDFFNRNKQKGDTKT